MLTSTDIDTLLARYEAMADAARANDWDRLSALEREAAALRNTFIARADSSIPLPADSSAVAERIGRILELDAEIRSHADPFLAAVRKLLSGGVRDRSVRSAYGALEP
jgi:flagellar protein FliT